MRKKESKVKEIDISKRTIFILVLLLIVISVVGTWVMLSYGGTEPVIQTTSKTMVLLGIQEPPEQLVQNSVISFSIVEKQ